MHIFDELELIIRLLHIIFLLLFILINSVILIVSWHNWFPEIID